MALRNIVEEEKPKILSATPTRLIKEPVHSPAEVIDRQSHNYRLKSEGFALNPQDALQNCRISANRDKYTETDLARNFALALNDLSKK